MKIEKKKSFLQKRDFIARILDNVSRRKKLRKQVEEKSKREVKEVRRGEIGKEKKGDERRSKGGV